MRQSGDLGYEGGLVELMMHASLTRLSFEVEVHPTLEAKGNRPDFLLRNADREPVAYVEVTTINPTKDAVAADRREAVIYDRLNRARIPEDLRLSYHVERCVADSPSLNKLLAAVEIWAREVADEARSGAVMERVFEAGDWEIGLRLVAGFRPRPGGRRIAFAMKRVFSMDTAEPAQALIATLDGKATRYGDLDRPYLLVVADRTDRLAYLAGDFAGNVAGGLFGPEITEDVALLDGRREMRHRRGDGFWLYQERPRHPGVSSVLVFPCAEIWKLRDQRWQPLLARNPFADRPLPPDLNLPWNELVMRAENGTVRPGRLAGDILGLPDPWPPEH